MVILSSGEPHQLYSYHGDLHQICFGVIGKVMMNQEWLEAANREEQRGDIK